VKAISLGVMKACTAQRPGPARLCSLAGVDVPEGTTETLGRLLAEDETGDGRSQMTSRGAIEKAA
jgi:hypothetical protein